MSKVLLFNGIFLILIVLTLNNCKGNIVKRRIFQGFHRGLNNRLNFLRLYGHHALADNMSKNHSTIFSHRPRSRLMPGRHQLFLTNGPNYKPGPRRKPNILPAMLDSYINCPQREELADENGAKRCKNGKLDIQKTNKIMLALYTSYMLFKLKIAFKLLRSYKIKQY